MSLLFDENLSRTLARRLVDVFPGAEHVILIGLEHAADDVIWARAAASNQTIVTKDADFAQRSFLYGPPPNGVWLRIGNASTGAIEALLRRRADDINLLHAGGIAAGILIIELGTRG